MWKSSLKYIILLILCLLHHGSTIFTQNPTNVTTCLGSPVVFTCVINESLPILWLINGQPLQSPPLTTPLTPGPGSQSTLSVTATSGLNGASVQCYYTPSVLLPSIVSPPAYLSVQAPPSAPTNLTITALNATSVLLAWGPPSGAQSPSLLYRVLVTSGNGTLVYNKTVKELQLILSTPDPCDQYWANVTSVYGNSSSIVCSGNSIMNAIKGGSPAVSQADTSYQYPSIDKDVNVTFVLPSKPGICYYMIMVMAETGTEVVPLNNSYPATGSIPVNINFLLPPMKRFIASIAAFNGYGNTTKNTTISTFSVINVTVTPPVGLICVYNPNSPAIGCVVHLKNISGITYCRVVMRSNNTLFKQILCPASYPNSSLSVGLYSVNLFDILNDSVVSNEPAVSISSFYLSIDLQDKVTPSILPGTSMPSQSSAIIGGVLGGAILLAAMSAVVIGVYKWKKVHAHVKPEVTAVECDGLECASPQHDQMTVETSHYKEVQVFKSVNRLPPEEKILYAAVFK